MIKLLLVVAVGFAGWWYFTRPDCGRAGALECPDKALDEGVGVKLARANVCAASGYYCHERGASFQVIRWPLDKGKLKIRVMPPEFISDAALAMQIRDTVVEGIMDWDRRPFPIEIDSKKAALPTWDIGVVWYHGGGGGHARVRTEPRGKRLHFTVEGVQVVVPVGGPYTVEQMLHIIRATASHEMGHALGLMHSDSQGDIMFPRYDHGVTSGVPSARDFRTVEALYALPAGATVE